MGIVDTAREAGSIIGYSEKTVCKLMKAVLRKQGTAEGEKTGEYKVLTIYQELKREAAKWVRQGAFTKDKPNMTTHSFFQWVNEDLLLSSHLSPHFP